MPNPFRFPRRPLCCALLGTLFGTALPLLHVAAAQAQPATAEQHQQYDIPAGPLDQALNRFASAAGVLMSVDARLTEGKRSAGLRGSYPVGEALRRLLAGSGLEAVRGGDGSYRLQVASGAVTLAPVKVSAAGVVDGGAALGYRSETVSQVGPWQGRKLDDLPYSITVLPAELIENVRGATVDQIFRINPTTQIGRLQIENYQANVRLGGFSTQSFRRDGLSGTRYGHDATLEDTDRVEVLSGLSGFLYGPGNVGGTVNLVTKRPTAERLNRLTARNNGGENFYLHGDFGGPIDRDGRFGYRINAAYQDGETAVDRAELRRTFLSAAFDWRVTDDLLLQASISDGDFLATGVQSNWGVAAGARRPFARDIDSSRSWAQPWAERHFETTSYGTNLRWDATDWLTLRAAWLQSDGRRYQQFVTNTFQADGTYTQAFDSFGVGPNREYYEEQDESRYQVFADIRFDTGTLSHTLTTGVQRAHTSNTYPPSNTWQAPLITLTGARLEDGPIYIHRPVFDPFVQQSIPENRYGTTTLTIGDDIHIDEQWSVLAGLSRATIESRPFGAQSYEESAVTPSLSLVYKPLPTVTTYASYMESLEQGGVAAERFGGARVANAGEIMEPLVSDQIEVGAKWSVGGMLLTTALFQIDKALQYYDITDPTAPVYVQDGRQVHRGIEFTAFGRVAERWSLVGGLTLLDADVREQKQNAALEGKRPTQAAERLLKLRAEYDTPWLQGLTLVGGFQYTSDQYVDALNTDQMPSYTLIDAGARYVTALAGKPLTARIEIQNLGDKRYWVNGAAIGDPRTVTFSVSVDL